MNLTSFEVEQFFASVAEPKDHVRTSEDVVLSASGANFTKSFSAITRENNGDSILRSWTPA